MVYEGRDDNRGYRPRQEGGGNRYRGGGGGPNRYNNRDNRRYNNNGGYQRRPYDRPPPPEPKGDEQEDIEVRLKGLIIKIGDKISSDLQVNLTKMRNILDNDFAKYPDTVRDTLKACVTELPAKAPVYGALIGLLNASSHDIVAKLMTSFNESLSTAVANGKWFEIKQFLRFYGELVNANVILPSVYITLLNDILAPLDEPNQLRQRLDCVVYLVLSTLPWCGKELAEANNSDLDHILKKIEIYMQRRGPVPALTIVSPYKNTLQEDALRHIWQLISELKETWVIDLIPKPYQWFDQEFTPALQHDVPRFTLPAEADSYIQPHTTMKLLVDAQGESLPVIPAHNSIEYFILQETISDTMELFEVNRKDCARYLLGIANSYEPKHFKSEHDEGSNTRWCLSDLLVESTFSHMLRLPTPPVRQVFYACIFIELCRAETATFPMALGRGVKTLFDRLPDMDVECINRLWSWFSHHLSNFGFQWDWKAWDQVLTLDPLHPQVCFVKEVLEKETRLSYYERMKSIIPAEFHPLIPAAAPGPDFEFKAPEHPLHEKAKTIIEALRTKKSVEEVRGLLADVKKDSDEPTTRLLFVQCLLLVGSKSFSHILNVVERYLDVLRFVNSAPEGRLHTVQIVSSFWKNNTQFLGILLDKLLNYRVIDPTSVITWVFEANQLKFVGRSFIWEILKNTLSKVNSRVNQVRAKLDNFQSLHETNKAKRAETEMTEMAEAEAQQELETLRIVENSLASVTREQKEVFMIVYQKFTQVLQELIKNQDWTFEWMFGWYKEILRLHHKECKEFLITLETLVFTDELDPKIYGAFEQVKSLVQEYTITV